MIKGIGSVLAEKNHPVVWVINGASFVGSYLSEKLLGKKCFVVVIDNWNSGVQENLNRLKGEKNFQVLDFDITADLPEILPPNYIFYLERTRQDAPDSSVPMLKELSRGIGQLLEIAVKNHAKFLFAYTNYNDERSRAKGVRFAQTLIDEFVKTKRLDGRTVCLGDPYGPQMPLVPDDPIASVLRDILYNLPPKVSIEKVSPVFVDDVASGLLAAMFGANTRSKNFSFGVEELNVNEFTERAQQAVYRADGILENLSFDPLSQKVAGSILPAFTPVEVGVGKTLRFFKENLTRTVKRTSVDAVPRKSNRLDRRYRSLLFLGLALLAVWFLALPPLTLAAGFATLGLTKKELANGDFDNAQLTSGLARSMLEFSQERFGNLEVLPLVSDFIHNARSRARTGSLIATVTIRASRIGEQGKKLFEGILDPSVKTSLELSDRLAIDLETLARDLDFLKTEDSVDSFYKDVTIDAKQLLPLSALIRQSDDLLGYKSKKVYLMLFQNNMELRATGGFIGSFGLLTLEKGKLVNFEVQDVYAADGQLKGHVEPPEKLREHLGEANWYLRDSNWDPDFPTSAQRAEWFLDKELNTRVDGVLAVDLDTVRELIGVVGPIKISDFNVTVDKNNFYEKTQFYAENNFFPGSTQKKDFLTAVTRELISKLRESSAQAVSIAHVLSNSFSGRHILGFLHNKDSQSAISQLGWDGGLKNSKCKVQNSKCLEDYLMVVDNNVGVNKANYGLSRSFLLNNTINKDEITHELTVSYLNKSSAQNGYKNYLRLYVPSGAVLSSVVILNSTTGERKAVQTDVSKEHERDVFGTLVEVPQGQTRQVLFSWQIPNPHGAKSLAFLWQKQPGTGEDPINILYKSSDNLKIRLTPAASLTQGDVVGYNTTFSGDLQINAAW